MARINWNKTFCNEQWLFDIDKSKKSKKKNKKKNKALEQITAEQKDK